MTEIVNIPSKRAFTSALKALLTPFGRGQTAKSAVVLADGLHVTYSGGLRLVFRPTEYEGIVTDVTPDSPTPTFVAARRKADGTGEELLP